ncbi:PHD-zinc-finger like domain-containing protein, partial [Ochromonadaceae sp. CCMP2298]
MQSLIHAQRLSHTQALVQAQAQLTHAQAQAQAQGGWERRRALPRATQCSACLLGDDPLLRCTDCAVGVHASCYACTDTPTTTTSDWRCYPCAQGLDCDTVSCELCGNTTPSEPQALLPTHRTGKWVHALCAQWIPEVRLLPPDKRMPLPSVDVSQLDKKRFKLKCALCGLVRGACVLCAHPRCQAAAHPLC